MRKPIASLKQSLEVLRYEAEHRGDRRSELLACLGLTNLIIAQVYEQVSHNLKDVYDRLPLESASSLDWIAPRQEWRNQVPRKTGTVPEPAEFTL